MAKAINHETLTRDEKSLLLYVETVCVDYGGLLEGVRMNQTDMESLARFKADDILDYGRVPAKLLGSFQRKVTHWCDLTESGWELAHKLRRARAENKGKARSNVDQYLAEKRAALLED